MLEVFHEAISFANLPATVLLAVVILYWIVSLLGMFDLEMLSAEADMDADGHSVESDGHTNPSSVTTSIFDFGDLPITIVASFFVLFFWLGTMISNYYLANSSLLFALVIYIPNIIFGFVLTKIIATPLSKLYRLLSASEEQESSVDFTGSVCTVMIETNGEKIGQGEINRNGDPIRINIKTSPEKFLKKGQTALLIEYYFEKGYYLAEPYESPK